jgi:hypothetical protein
MNGICKCGAIKFISGEPLQVVNCHCNLCRSINGSAFSTYVVTKIAELKIEAGTQLLATFDATDHAVKHFCRQCGTPLYNTNPHRFPELAMIYLGIASSHRQLMPGINIYCSSKLDWVDKVPSIRSFDEAPQRG